MHQTEPPDTRFKMQLKGIGYGKEYALLEEQHLSSVSSKW